MQENLMGADNATTDDRLLTIKLDWSLRKVEILEEYRNEILTADPKEEYPAMGVETARIFGPEQEVYQTRVRDYMTWKMTNRPRADVVQTTVDVAPVPPVTMINQQDADSASGSTDWSLLAPGRPATLSPP